MDGSKDLKVRDGDQQQTQESNNNPSNKRKFVDYYIVGCSNVASMPTRVTEKHQTVTSVNRTIQPRHEASNKNSKRTKILQNRREFPYGSIVSINGRDMDDYTWKDRREAPTFLGIVQNPDHHDGREAASIDLTCESYVTFVTAGHYEWLDTKLSNTLSGVFDDASLNFISFPPTNDKRMRYHGPMDPLRHFEKVDGKWSFRKHKNPCFQCGSPWCKFKKHHKMVIDIVDEKKNNGKPGSNKQKRFQCYVGIANNILRDTDLGFRIRLGWCVTNYVRGAFPEEEEENYTGFKYGKNMCPYPGDSSDSDTLYQK